MTKDNEHRISVLETNYCNLNEKITEIADNHLVHLANDIKEVKTSIARIDIKLAYWSGAIVVAIWLLDKFLK